MSNGNKTTSNYSILSNREKFDDKQKKVIDKVKLDLFESLDIDNKLVNRNNLAKKLEILRVDNKLGYPFGKVELRPGMSVDIGDTNYKDILDKYKDLLKNKPNGFESDLNKLDSQLAERIVLDQGGAIEFKTGDDFSDGKDAKKESELAFDGLNQLTQYQNKIERASKKVDNIDYFVIKWNDDELQKIKEAEDEIKEKLKKENIVDKKIQEEYKIIDDIVKPDEKIDIGEPSLEETIKNSNLIDIKKVNRANELLYSIANKNKLILNNLGNNVLSLILFAYESTILDETQFNELGYDEKQNYKKIGDKYYQIGEDGVNIASIGNYSKSQLKEKVKILQSTSGLENWQIQAILKYGFCSIDKNSVENIDNETEKKGKEQDKIIKDLQEKIDQNNKDIEELKKKLNELNSDPNLSKNEKEKNKESIEKLDISLFVNRDNLAKSVSNSRLNSNFPSGSIEIKAGEYIDLESQDFFEEFKQKYIEARDNKMRLKDLDTEFAERIILSNPRGSDISKRYQIQINNDESGQNNKTEEELVKESLRCRDSLKNLGYNVEYVRYTEKGEQVETYKDRLKNSYSKKIKDEIDRLNLPGRNLTPLDIRSLSIYKSLLDGTYTKQKIENRLSILDQPGKNRTSLEDREFNILKEALKNFERDNTEIKSEGKVYHIIRQKEERTIPIPPVPDPIETKGLELDAVISDMGTDVHRERVSLETEEELRDRYKGLARYNVPMRGYLFLSRGAKRKRMIKKKMKDLSGKAFAGDQGLDEKTGDASDRHELELQHKLSEVEKANSVTLQNPLVNNLCKDYLNGIVNDTGFQTQFNTIVDNDSNIQSILKGQKITHIGTNILLKLKQQKAKMDLMNKVDTELNQYFSNNNQIHINNINKEIENYIKLYQTNPDFMKDYEDLINNVPGAKNKLQLYFQHQKATMKMQVENIKMNMNILVKGKSAYQIDNKDRQKGRMYKLGNKLDKLPRWVQTAGFIGIVAGTGLATGGMGTFAAAAITTGVTASSVGFLNAIKKRTHHTKEQNTHEKNVVTDNKNEQARIAERQNQALNGKWYKRKTYKAKRQLALYDQTTQENIQITNTISDSITDLSSKIGSLDAKEENYMKKNLIEGRARLKYYRETGHNFLASNEKEQIEKDMKRLEKSLILGSGKLGKNLNDIETMQARDDLGGNITYDSIQKDLKNSYDKSLIQFKRERRNLAIKYGVGTAVMSAGMSIGMQYLMGTGVFAKGEPGTTGVAFTEGAKENFELGKHNLLDTGTQNNIYNAGTDVLKDPRLVAGSEINIAFGAGTDATGVIPGNLTSADYSTKLTEVVSNIRSMGLSSDMEKQFVDIINSEPWKAGWSANFTNDALHGMRSAEFIEQTARAFADSGRTDLVVKFAYDSSLDIAGTNVHNVAERVVNATYNISTPDIPGTPASNRGRFLVAPLFFNTFKDRVKGKENEQKDDLPKDEPVKPKKGLDNPMNPIGPKVNPTITDKPGYWGKNWEEHGKNPFKDDGFEPIGPKPFDKNNKIGVTPRATFFDNIDIDPKDLGKEYPRDFRLKTDDEIADIIIDQKVPLYKDQRFGDLYNDTLKIEKALNNGDRNTAKNILKESLKKEREFIKQEEVGYKKSIDTAFDLINKKFDEIGGDRSQLPDKSKVHIVGNYEFRGQNGEYDEDTLGFCSYMDGELFINRDALYYESSSDEGRQRRLIHTIVHEIIHGTSTANYRHQYKDETKLGREDFNNRYPNARRLGAMLRRFSKNSDGSIKIQERGRALNEGITEQLTIDILNKELNFDAPSDCYPQEREVLKMVCKVYNIDVKDFYKLLVNRKISLKNINEKLSTKVVGNKEVKTPSFYSLLMSIMDYEYDQEYNKEQSNSYKLTKALINGETLMVTPEMRKFFHPGLLENGEIKKDILDDYKNILDVGGYRAAA